MVGFAGVDDKGLAGLELERDGTLSGRPGRETVIKDPFGRVVDVLDSVPERDGHDVFLTIDHTIQSKAEDALRAAVAQWHAKRATRDRARPAHGRRAGHGDVAGLRREQLRRRAAGVPAQLAP